MSASCSGVLPTYSANGAFLMAVQAKDLFRDALAEVWVEQPFAHEGIHRGTFPERVREADVGAFEQRRAAGFVQRQQFAHLLVQVRVRERVSGELVAQEALDDVLGVGDGV